MFRWLFQGGCLFKVIVIAAIFFLSSYLMDRVSSFFQNIYWWMFPS